MKPLKTYVTYVKVYALGESEADVAETVLDALERSDILDQDGVVGFDVTDDVELDENQPDYEEDEDE